MFPKPVSGFAGIALVLACAVAQGVAPRVAYGQDFQVSTRIHDVPQAGKKAPRAPHPQCFSLFNAGKVYDYNGSGTQVTIFEPAQDRFMIIDSATRTSTFVSFEYIEHRLHQARAVRTEELQRAPKKAAAYLEFELNPEFQVEFDKARQLLVLDSPFVKYTVKCFSGDSPELVNEYLNYADWAARLNYVAYRTSTLPAPRLAVNEQLRQRGLLPVSVELEVKVENGPHLRAEHKFTWELNGNNRTFISHWDKISTSRDVKHLAPGEFFEPSIKPAKHSR